MEVIEKSKYLVKIVYDISKKLPDQERYILIPQILRAAISIPSNISEGNQRGAKEFSHFLRIARGSLFELKFQIELIRDIYHIDVDGCLNMIDEIGKMTHGLLKYLSLRSESEVCRD